MPSDSQLAGAAPDFSRRALLVAACGVLLALGCGEAPPDVDKPLPPPPDMNDLRGSAVQAPPEKDSR